MASLRSIVKTLNDLKECFWVQLNEECLDEAVSIASDSLERAMDGAQNYYEELDDISKSDIFGFDESARLKFINDLIDMKTVEEAIAKFQHLAVSNIVRLLEQTLPPGLIIISEGSTYHGFVLSYELKLKADVTFRNFFDICRKFMDHSAHGIEEIEYIDEKTIKVWVDEST